MSRPQNRSPYGLSRFSRLALLAGLGMLALLSLAGLGACSKGGGGSDKLTLAVGGAPAELEFWEKLTREFEERHGIAVELLRHPTDTDQRRQGLVVSLKSGEADPDVFLMDVAWIAQFAASGWLEDLGALAGEQLEREAFFQRVIEEAGHYQNQLVALPVYVDGGLLYYRKDLLEQAGVKEPPATWEELVAHSTKIQESQRRDEPGFYGFVWQGKQYEGLVCNFLEFSASNGGGFRAPSAPGEPVSVAGPANAEALRLMRDLIRTHKVSPPSTYTEMDEEEVRSWFQQGKALFERNWPYAWALHQADDSPVKGKVGIAPLPHFPGHSSAATLGGWHVGVSRHSDRKAEAWQLARFITSYEVQKRMALELGWNPGRSEVYSDSTVLARLPHFKELRAVFENAVARPNLPYYTQVSEALQRHLSSALAGKVEPAEALRQAQEEIIRISDRYGR